MPTHQAGDVGRGTGRHEPSESGSVLLLGTCSLVKHRLSPGPHSPPLSTGPPEANFMPLPLASWLETYSVILSTFLCEEVTSWGCREVKRTVSIMVSAERWHWIKAQHNVKSYILRNIRLENGNCKLVPENLLEMIVALVTLLIYRHRHILWQLGDALKIRRENVFNVFRQNDRSCRSKPG